MSNTLLIDIQKFNGITRKIKAVEVELNSVPGQRGLRISSLKKRSYIQSKLSLARHKVETSREELQS